MDIQINGKGDTPFHLLHHLWTKAVGTQGYVKEEWRQMEACILRLEALDKPNSEKPDEAYRP